MGFCQREVLYRAEQADNYFIIIMTKLPKRILNNLPEFKLFVEDYNVPLTPWYIIHEAFQKKISKYFKHYRLKSLFVFEKNRVLWGPTPNEWNKLVKEMEYYVGSHGSFVNRIIEGHYSNFRKIDLFCHSINKRSLKKCTSKQLYKIYERYYNIFLDNYTWGMIIQLLDMGDIKFSDNVKKGLAETYGDKTDEIFSALITPTKHNQIKDEKKAVLKLLKKIQSDRGLFEELKNAENIDGVSKNFAGRIKNLHKKFGWLQYYYYGPAAPIGYYFEILKKKLGLNAEQELDEIKKKDKEFRRKQAEYEKDLSGKDKSLIKTLREFMYLKEARKEKVYYLNYSMDEFFRELGRRLYISPVQARYILKDEYRKILFEGRDITEDLRLDQRCNYSAYLSWDFDNFLVTDRTVVKKLESRYRREKIKAGGREIKGDVAYQGIARGIVKICNSPEDLKKFNSGDVLVSFATNPTLIMAMQKSVAIITDSGGITCHAAIVSRELMIPCVIGTKIATKVLKDGDLVEVDANKGVVKMIKRAE